MPPKSFKRRLPKVGTTASERYYQTFLRTSTFLNWILYMAGAMAEVSDHITDVLIKVETDPKKKKELLEKRNREKVMITQLKENRQIFLELVHNRYIENYLNYLSELLAIIFRSRPETLRSSDQVEVATVLQHNNLEEFIRAESERRVDRLSYKSFDALEEFFKRRFGLTLFELDQRDFVIRAVEVRNISVHNRCVINEVFCRKTQTEPSNIGSRYALFIENIEELEEILFDGVKRLDSQARKKLGIKGLRYGELAAGKN